MNIETINATDDANTQTADAVHAVLRFLRTLRYRKAYVITSVVVAGMLGAVHYFTATRIYEASASLMVTPTGAEVWNTAIPSEGARESLIPTCERLFSSAVVLDGALQRLRQLPAPTRIDFSGSTREKWVDILRENLSARAIRRTNIIELIYRSKSPQAAEAVVNSVVESYLEFMERNHKDVSVEVATILENELREKEKVLESKQNELVTLKSEVGVVVKDGDHFVHPLVQRATKLNVTLIDVRKRRIELEASLAAIRTATRNGGDLRQHLLAVEPYVGREMIMSAMGLNPQFTQIVNTVEQQLIEERARLETLSSHYGPTHPEIVESKRSIQNKEQYLSQYQVQVNGRLDQLQGGELGPMLTAMVEERLSETWSNENELLKEYKRAEATAVQLNGRMAKMQLVEDEVARLRNWHETLLNQIANIDLKQERANVRVAIVSEPLASQIPVSPRLSVVGMMCLLGGVGFGSGLVYILDLLDDRFRSPDELREQVGAPVLAIVGQLQVSNHDGAESVQMHIAPNAVESEAFRTLRTTLAFSNDELQRLAITSAEPGDGKTTMLANLGASYAYAGKRTILVDCDLRRPGLSKLFQMRGMPGISEVLRSTDDVATMCEERIRTAGFDGLDILPCGPKPPDPAELLSTVRFAEVVAWAETRYDQVLIDCPPALAASDAAIVGRAVDGVILVVQPAKNHRRLVLRAAESLVALQVNLIGLIANRIGDKGTDGYGEYGYGYGYGYSYGDDEDVVESSTADGEDSPENVPPRRAA